MGEQAPQHRDEVSGHFVAVSHVLLGVGGLGLGLGLVSMAAGLDLPMAEAKSFVGTGGIMLLVAALTRWSARSTA